MDIPSNLFKIIKFFVTLRHYRIVIFAGLNVRVFHCFAQIAKIKHMGLDEVYGVNSYARACFENQNPQNS